jgi:hypothetical protein
MIYTSPNISKRDWLCKKKKKRKTCSKSMTKKGDEKQRR